MTVEIEIGPTGKIIKLGRMVIPYEPGWVIDQAMSTHFLRASDGWRRYPDLEAADEVLLRSPKAKLVLDLNRLLVVETTDQHCTYLYPARKSTPE